jgi:hypothetical protein
VSDKIKRHRWPIETTVREEYRTVRTCPDCGLQRITHHQAQCWVDFRRGDLIVSKDKTPECITRDQARVLADAGFMPLKHYVDLCRQNGWIE